MCKKISAILIALVMVFSAFSLSVFAVEQENLNSSSGDVLVKYDDGGHPATYSVDITWGAMKFDYKANEVWNPETHKWEIDLDNTYCEPVGDSNIITIANNSSVPVDAEFYFEGLSEYGEIYSDFYSDNATFKYSSLAMPVAEENAEAEKIDVEFRLWKDFSSDLEDYTKVGTITVILSDHDDLLYEQINDGTEYAVVDSRALDATEVTIPSEHNGKPVTKISDWAFSGAALTEINLPSSIKEIGEYAFSDNDSLERVTLNEGLEVIGTHAFRQCYKLSEINFPSTVNQIGTSIFRECYGLTTITVDSANTNYHSAGNCLIETNTKTLHSGCKTSVIPDDGSVTKIGNFAFNCCDGIINVELNEHITEIGEFAFAAINTLVSVSLPDSVTTMGDYAFRQNYALTNITVPSTASFGRDCFAACRGLYVIKTDDASAFTFGSTENGKLTENAKVFIDDSGITCKPEEDGTTYLMDGDFLYSVKNDEYSLIAYIGKSGTVTLPETVNSKNYKLDAMKGLVNVTIPSSFTKIDDNAFSFDTGITEISIPQGVQSIGSKAFSYCYYLSNVDIPVSVTEIKDNAFLRCVALHDINYAGTKAQWNAITKGTDWQPEREYTVHCSDGDIG